MLNRPESTPAQIARDLFEMHRQNPQSIIDKATDRLAETGSLFIYSLRESTAERTRSKPGRAHKLLQQADAYRDGVSVAFLYHDRLAAFNGTTVPSVHYGHYQTASVEARQLTALGRLAQENLPSEPAKELTSRRFKDYMNKFSYPLLLCVASILTTSPLYVGRTKSQQAFFVGVFEIDGMLR